MKMGIWLFAALALSRTDAQTITSGEITGVVTDSSGAIVVGAAVRLKNIDTGEERIVKSNSAGIYRLVFVQPGTYEFSGASEGLRSDTGRLVAAVGQVQVLNLTLKIEQPKEVVLVTDLAPLLQTDNANATYTLSTRQLEMLPLPGGDLTGVAYSMPGVVINNQLGNGNFASQGIGSSSNLFTVNGVDDMDPYYNTNNYGVTGLLLGANEIREVSIVQNAYEGQYGRQAGAQVNYVTKSGTNAYHGNLLYNYNGSLLNANDFIRNREGLARPHEVSNQYAAAAGGRIVRDKLFFFADTEGLRYALPSSNSVIAIPSPEFESYSLRTIQPAQAPLYQQMFDLYNNSLGHEHAAPVTTGSGPLQDSSGTGGCGRVFAGTPTGTGAVFGRDVSCAEAWPVEMPDQISEWLLSTRVDYSLNSKQQLFFRFKTDHGFSPSNLSAISPAFATQSTFPDYEGQVNYTYVISPRLVNNFIGSANYNVFVTGYSDLAGALKLFPFRFNFPFLIGNGFGLAFLGAPAGAPSGRRAGQFQLVDDISYNTGRHSWKAGFNYRYNREADLLWSQLTVIPKFAFSGLGELASGVLSRGNFRENFTSNPILHLRLYNAGFYLQDQWAVSRSLKLTADVRFDRNGNPTCVNRCFARLISPFADLSKGLSIPYNQSIQAGLQHEFYGVDHIVPEPRVAVVYNPSWSRHTVIHAGVGSFSDLYPALFAGTMADNAPNVFNALITHALVNTGGPGSAPYIASNSARAFQGGFASGAMLSQLQQAVAPALFGPPQYNSLPQIVRSPRYLEWSLDVQHRFGANNVLTVRYSGNHGYDIFLFNQNVNAAFDLANYPNGFAGLPPAIPDERFSGINQLTNNGYSNYAGLSTTFRRAFGHGFQGQVGYVWSHALDNVSNGGFGLFATGFSPYDSIVSQITPGDPRALSYGNADYDVRHNFTADFVWNIAVKFGNRAVNSVFSNWSLAGKINARTVTPFTVYNSQVTISSSFQGYVLADLVDPNVRMSCGHSAVDTPCFTADQFGSAASQRDLGNLARNSFRGPGYFDVDASVYKGLHPGEHIRLTVGASAYNLLNHVNLANPNSDVGGGGFGSITATASGPSGPYGYGGLSSRAVVMTGRLTF
jgi:hypothetical protein